MVAHRDIASLSDPALQQQLASLPASAQHAIEIIPQPLTVKAVARWLGTLFRVRSATTTDLATLIHEKTGGNPLFVHEFSAALLMTGWWCITSIRINGSTICRRSAPGITPKMSSPRVLEKLEEMPDETRRLLGSIACLGGTGELEMLCRVVAMSVAEIRYALHPAVMAQLIVLTEKRMPLPMTGCRRLLSHCWISERSHLHLTTASLLAEAARQAAGNELLFRAVHHVTAALDSIQPRRSARCSASSACWPHGGRSAPAIIIRP